MGGGVLRGGHRAWGGVGAGAGGWEAAPCCLFWSVGGQGRACLFFFVPAWAERWWDWAGVGLEEGLCSLLARVPQPGLRRCLHGRFRMVVREVGEFLYCLWGGSGPWQCRGAVLEMLVEVVATHGLCLLNPGLRGFRCVWTVEGSLGAEERRVEDLPRGAPSACGSGGLYRSLQA